MFTSLSMALLSLLAPGACKPAEVPPCAAGAEVIVHGNEPTPCNLDGSNTLVILNITEAACDQVGGRWVYEACEDADF